MSPFVYRGNHTETVDIDYDPSQTTYEDLLKHFWKCHDAVSPRSSQYMSAIFYHDDNQKSAAELSKHQEQKNKFKPIVTKILPADFFYVAEE